MICRLIARLPPSFHSKPILLVQVTNYECMTFQADNLLTSRRVGRKCMYLYLKLY